MTLRWTYDERVDDGLSAWFTLRRIKQIVEDPESVGLVVEALPAGRIDDGPDQPRVDDPALS